MAEAGGASETPRDGLKDLVDRFGLTEVLGYIFPGVILLCAIFIWGTPDPAMVFGAQLAQNQFVTGVVILIFAYATGHIISMWSMAGAEAFRNHHKPFPPFGLRERFHFAWDWIRWKWLRLTVGMAENWNDAKWNALLAIEQKLGAIFTIESMPLLLGRHAEQLLTLRAVAADQLKDKVSALIAEADVCRRRLMFSLGVAVALLFLAASALVRLAAVGWAHTPFWFHSDFVRWNSDHRTHVAVLIVVIAFSSYSSFKLRRVAVHCWEKELVMTLAILRRFPYGW